MSKRRKSTPKKNEQRLSTEAFFKKYAHLIPATTDASIPAVPERLARSIPFTQAIHNLNIAGFAAVLQAAKTSNNRGAFIATVDILLDALDVESSESASSKVKTTKGGRPIGNQSEKIISKWLELGEPPPHSTKLARAVYGAGYEDASGTTRRQMRDRCRNVLYRHVDREIRRLTVELQTKNEMIAELEEQLRNSAGDVESPRGLGPLELVRRR